MELPADPRSITLPEYHHMILRQRAEQHAELVAILEQIVRALQSLAPQPPARVQ